MRTPVRLLSLVVAMTAVGVVLVGGCAGDRAPQATSAQHLRGSAPRLGGPVPEHEAPPHRAMSRLEQPVAARLSRQIARDGLTLEFLACPRWDGAVPRSMACRGYVDGLVAVVEVRLTASRAGGQIGFHARLVEGVIATRTLERTLVGHGLASPDCGSVAAYPAVVGNQVTCRGLRSGRVRYVVATVTHRSGKVRISDYGDTDAGG